MSALLNFAFEESLVRVVMHNGDPWFVGADICRALGIKNNRDAVENLDDDEKGVANTDTLGGPQQVVIICEAAVFKLAFTSRKPEAKRFTRWVAHEVLPAIRRTGRYGCAPQLGETPQPGIDYEALPLAERVHRLELVKAAYRMHGRPRALQMWNQLGLPPVPPAPPTGRDEAHDCLEIILSAVLREDEPCVRDLLERAIEEDDENARALLLHSGILPGQDGDHFVLANNHPGLNRILDDTVWDAGRYARALRRLPGVIAMRGTTRRFNGMNRRGTLVPARYLDPAAFAKAA